METFDPFAVLVGWAVVTSSVGVDDGVAAAVLGAALAEADAEMDGVATGVPTVESGSATWFQVVAG